MALPPKFVPRTGQIDYTNIKRAPVINCIVKHGEKILIVRRNPSMTFYPGVWNGISGFLDEPDKTIEEKVKEELREELSMPEENILSIKEGAVIEQEDPEYKKTWIVHPVLVEVESDELSLDWEADQYKWVDPETALTFPLLPGFGDVIGTFFNI